MQVEDDCVSMALNVLAVMEVAKEVEVVRSLEKVVEIECVGLEQIDCARHARIWRTK